MSKSIIQAERIVASPIVDILKQAAANPGISLERKDVERVASAVVEEVAPIVAHATNTEAWWRSRVTLGSIAAIVGGVGAIAAEIQMRSWNVETISAGIGSIAGGAFSLYGRWSATRPLGS